MFPPNYPEGHASDRPDPSEERRLVWKELPAVDSGWTRSLGNLHEPWYWDGAESDGVGEENQRRREQVAALRPCTFTGEIVYWDYLVKFLLYPFPALCVGSLDSSFSPQWPPFLRNSCEVECETS